MPGPDTSRRGSVLPDSGAEEFGHPRGTLAIVGLFGLLFGLAWLFTYLVVFLGRGASH